MNESPDPFDAQRRLWRGYGDFVVRSLGASRAEVDAIHRDFEQSALTMETTNPRLSKIASEMAAEFYSGALDALK